MADVGLLALRLALGVIYLGHGVRKLGWGGREGFAGFRASVARRGYRPAAAWAALAVGSEIGGAILVSLGLLSFIGASLLFAQSVTIIGLVRSRGFWHDAGGTEYPIQLATASLALALIGPGALSLDAALALAPDPWLVVAAVIVAGGGALAGLARRRQTA